MDTTSAQETSTVGTVSDFVLETTDVSEVTLLSVAENRNEDFFASSQCITQPISSLSQSNSSLSYIREESWGILYSKREDSVITWYKTLIHIANGTKFLVPSPIFWSMYKLGCSFRKWYKNACTIPDLYNFGLDLLKDTFTVGRVSTSDYVISLTTFGRDFKSCSRRHFEILRDPTSNTIFIKNLSPCGTYIDGTLIEQNEVRSLIDGSRISMLKPYLEVFLFYDLLNRIRTTNLPLEITKNYLISNEIGKGGFGKVYSVTKLRNAQNLAMKSVKFDPVREKYPLNEVNILYTVRHLNVVTVSTTHITDDDQLYIFMELMQGGDLHSFLEDRESVLAEAEAKYICYQLALAVEALHDHDIVHRDVKPKNILLCNRESYPHVKLSDFGLSKILSKRFEQVPVTKFYGTRTFTAPELNNITDGQRMSATYDNRSDIWSLGLVFYYIFSRQLPFNSNYTKLSEISEIRKNKNFVPFDVWRHISMDAKSIICDMLSITYSKRPMVKKILQFPYFNNDDEMRARLCAVYVKKFRKFGPQDGHQQSEAKKMKRT